MSLRPSPPQCVLGDSLLLGYVRPVVTGQLEGFADSSRSWLKARSLSFQTKGSGGGGKENGPGRGRSEGGLERAHLRRRPPEPSKVGAKIVGKWRRWRQRAMLFERMDRRAETAGRVLAVIAIFTQLSPSWTLQPRYVLGTVTRRTWLRAPEAWWPYILGSPDESPETRREWGRK